MTQYVALLRGINLGKRRIKMAELGQDFEDWGFSEVETVLASGNMIFASEERDQAKVQAMIEAGFEESHGWDVPTCVRRAKEIRDLAESKPFANVPEDHNQYITFLAEPPKKALELPFEAVGGAYRILDVQPGHVVSALDRSQGSGTLDVMEVLEDLFGESITTRNWNTVLKIHARLNDD
jgi:uncharacterized protein (DUF1697 family)